MNVSLPSELDEWVQSRADEIGVEPELIVQQILDSHRTANLEWIDEAGESAGLDRTLLDAAVQRKIYEWVDEEFDAVLEDRLAEKQWPSGELQDQLDERIEEKRSEWLAEELEDSVDTAIERTLDEQLDRRVAAALDERETDIDDRLDSLADDLLAKIEDLRERVIQIKRETDEKAPADELQATRERVKDLSEILESTRTRTEELGNWLGDVKSDLEDIDAIADRIADLEAELAEATDRLNTLGWHVSKLNDRPAVRKNLDDLRQRAAELDVTRAKCETCSTTVDIGLLTRPACPHCGSTASGVEPARSFFGKPRLLTTPD